MSQNPIAVILVDDHAIMRQGLRLLIEENDDIVIVAEAKTGRDLMEKLNIHEIAGLTRFAIATGCIKNRGQISIGSDASKLKS